MTFPTIKTARLVLRGFQQTDAKRVQLLAGEYAIADTTLNIPHPYEDGLAEGWIETHVEDYAERKSLSLAICCSERDLLIGSIGLLDIDNVHKSAELGYWVGKDYWGNGFCTEAARSLLDYGFNHLSLNRIWAHLLVRNPASGRVLENIGLVHEGRLRESVVKWGKFEDVDIYGALKKDFEISV